MDGERKEKRRVDSIRARRQKGRIVRKTERHRGIGQGGRGTFR